MLSDQATTHSLQWTTSARRTRVVSLNVYLTNTFINKVLKCIMIYEMGQSVGNGSFDGCVPLYLSKAE